MLDEVICPSLWVIRPRNRTVLLLTWTHSRLRLKLPSTTERGKWSFFNFFLRTFRYIWVLQGWKIWKVGIRSSWVIWRTPESRDNWNYEIIGVSSCRWHVRRCGMGKSRNNTEDDSWRIDRKDLLKKGCFVDLRSSVWRRWNRLTWTSNIFGSSFPVWFTETNVTNGWWINL